MTASVRNVCFLSRALDSTGGSIYVNLFDKRLANLNQAEVGGFVSKIDSDGAVFLSRFGRCAHVSPLCHQVSSADETR